MFILPNQNKFRPSHTKCDQEDPIQLKKKLITLNERRFIKLVPVEVSMPPLQKPYDLLLLFSSKTKTPQSIQVKNSSRLRPTLKKKSVLVSHPNSLNNLPSTTRP